MVSTIERKNTFGMIHCEKYLRTVVNVDDVSDTAYILCGNESGDSLEYINTRVDDKNRKLFEVRCAYEK